jgi:hypothetical protein
MLYVNNIWKSKNLPCYEPGIKRLNEDVCYDTRIQIILNAYDKSFFTVN